MVARYNISREFAQMGRTPRLRDKGGQLWRRPALAVAYLVLPAAVGGIRRPLW